jgi:hypothetical protein
MNKPSLVGMQLSAFQVVASLPTKACSIDIKLMLTSIDINIGKTSINTIGWTVTCLEIRHISCILQNTVNGHY